jgi:hypothetical protein
VGIAASPGGGLMGAVTAGEGVEVRVRFVRGGDGGGTSAISPTVEG